MFEIIEIYDTLSEITLSEIILNGIAPGIGPSIGITLIQFEVIFHGIVSIRVISPGVISLKVIPP